MKINLSVLFVMILFVWICSFAEEDKKDNDEIKTLTEKIEKNKTDPSLYFERGVLYEENR